MLISVFKSKDIHLLFPTICASVCVVTIIVPEDMKTEGGFSHGLIIIFHYIALVCISVYYNMKVFSSVGLWLAHSGIVKYFLYFYLKIESFKSLLCSLFSWYLCPFR